MGSDVIGTKRGALPPTFQAVIGRNAHNGCIETAVFPTAGEALHTSGIGKIDLEDINFNNFHNITP